MSFIEKLLGVLIIINIAQFATGLFHTQHIHTDCVHIKVENATFKGIKDEALMD